MGYLINIDELFFHPEFDRKTLTNNLVLLKTRKALRFRKQRVVAIQYDRAPSALKPDVENVIILGWGRRKTDEADRPQEETPLSEATVEVYDFDSCQYIYTEEFVTNKTFCAGFGAGACNHDAGGPALLDNVLVGVISFGSPHCGATEAPTVFTRVGLYHQWIEDVFQKITQNPEVRSETNKQMNDDDYVKNQILDVDEAMKDIYRENFNVDDVLYGPIEALDENDNPIVVNQSVLRNFQNDLSLFPDPEFLALLPQPETPKPELPDEYWRDEPSNEQTNTTNEETTTTNEQTTTTNEQTTTTYEETTTTYEETTTAYKEATTTYEEITTTSEQTTTTSDNYELEEEEDQFLAIEVTHTTNLPQVTQDVKSSLRIGTTESSQSEIYNDNKFNDIKTSEEDCAIRYRLCKKRKKAKASDNIRENVNEFDSDSNNVLVNPRRDQLEPKPPKPKIDADEDDDMAVIVLLDSFTTQRIEVHKNDPVYERGFKVLATKVLQAQELV
ncbi:uncharacterized protein LOC125237821 isoform X2 [Leguminivora glycinivorella]|nr:uncharacterized protein LOC125237821 isoform X2 [Leguminivora glycinivorella]